MLHNFLSQFSEGKKLDAVEQRLSNSHHYCVPIPKSSDLDPEPDPAFYLNADPSPDPGQTLLS